MLTAERRKEIFSKVSEYLQNGGVSPFLARANGQLHKVAEQIGISEADLREHYAMLDQELPPVGDY